MDFRTWSPTQSSSTSTYSLDFTTLDTVAAQLGSNKAQVLAGGLTVHLSTGGTMEICENGKKIFSMSVTSFDGLTIDRPETVPAHRRRGLATLGVYLAVAYGKAQGQKIVKLGTSITGKTESMGFWASVGIGGTTPIDKPIEKIQANEGSQLTIKAPPQTKKTSSEV